MTIYTHPTLVLKKYEGGKGEEEKNTHTHRLWAVRAQLIGLIGGNGMNAGVRWFKGEGERKEKALLLLLCPLPSVVSQRRSIFLASTLLCSSI